MGEGLSDWVSGGGGAEGLSGWWGGAEGLGGWWGRGWVGCWLSWVGAWERGMWEGLGELLVGGFGVTFQNCVK